jgi:ankyrin repeat protein
MLLLLMEHGADLNLKNEDGATALKLARDRGRKEVAAMLAPRGCEGIDSVIPARCSQGTGSGSFV